MIANSDPQQMKVAEVKAPISQTRCKFVIKKRLRDFSQNKTIVAKMVTINMKKTI